MTRDLNLSVQLDEPHNEEANDNLYVCPSDRAARAWRVRLGQQRAGVAVPVCTHVEAWMAELWSRAQIFGLLGDARTPLEPVIASALWQHAAREVTDLAAPERARCPVGRGRVAAFASPFFQRRATERVRRSRRQHCPLRADFGASSADTEP